LNPGPLGLSGTL